MALAKAVALFWEIIPLGSKLLLDLKAWLVDKDALAAEATLGLF